MADHEVESFYPTSKQAWRAWLQKHHATKQSVWMIRHKKNSNMPTISWQEAVEEALCFGWIDSKAKSIDHEKFMQFFCKRKPNSTWSKINKDKVEQLIADGLMSQAGQDVIVIAKQNGSWTILDDVEALIIPEDLEEALNLKLGAAEYFNNLNKSSKKLILYWLVSAKREETRHKRIAEIAESACQKLMPKPYR